MELRINRVRINRSRPVILKQYLSLGVADQINSNSVDLSRFKFAIYIMKVSQHDKKVNFCVVEIIHIDRCQVVSYIIHIDR